MSEKRTIKVIVFQGPMPFKAVDFQSVVDFVNDKMKEIPSKYQTKATWSMAVPEKENEVSIVIAYKRLETDEEKAVRDDKDLSIKNKNLKKRIEKAKLLIKEYSDIIDIKPEFLKE